MIAGSIKRTVIAAAAPRRFADARYPIFLKVWFEELPKPVEFVASPFDCEIHGRALWARAIAGQYGEIAVLPAAPAAGDVRMPA